MSVFRYFCISLKKTTHPLVTPTYVPTCLSQFMKLCVVPKSPFLAILKPKWKSVMLSKFKALYTNNTWEIIPRSCNTNVLNTKWIFKVKQKDGGSVDRHKVWLVSNGMWQIEGSYYTQTFSLVVKANLIRSVLTMEVSKGWGTHTAQYLQCVLTWSSRREDCGNITSWVWGL